jgi:hypothetical protein
MMKMTMMMMMIIIIFIKKVRHMHHLGREWLNLLGTQATHNNFH